MSWDIWVHMDSSWKVLCRASIKTRIKRRNDYLLACKYQNKKESNLNLFLI